MKIKYLVAIIMGLGMFAVGFGDGIRNNYFAVVAIGILMGLALFGWACGVSVRFLVDLIREFLAM